MDMDIGRYTAERTRVRKRESRGVIMPSHEDYLDRLLREMESGRVPKPENPPEDILPEDALPGELSSADVLPEETLLEDILPDSILPEDIMPDEILPEDVSVEQLLPEELSSVDVLPEDALSADALLEDLASGEVLSEDILSGEIIPEDILSGEVILEDALSEENLPEDILPGEILPEDVLAEQSLPEELLSADVLPEETLLEDVLSDVALPEDILSGEIVPEDILPAEILPEDVPEEQLLPEELPSADMLPEEYLSEDVMPEEFLSEDVLPEDILSEVTLPEDVFSDETIFKDTLSDEIEREPLTELSSAPDLEAVSEMSEEEINRFLAAGAEESLMQENAGESASDELPDKEDVDLLEMLEKIDNSDLMDIQDMLEKDDHNEAVNEEIEALLSGETGVTELEDEKSKRAREKKRQRQEKAAAKKAAKAASKEAKAAAKGTKRDAKTVDMEGGAAAVTENEPDGQGMDNLFDADLLDSIVSGADRAGQEEAVQDQITATESDDISEAEPANEPGDDMDFDMSSLFGEVDDSSLGGDISSDGAGSAFPDFVDIDGNNVDAIMPELEIGEKKKKGLLARFFDMLTEEAEEEESESLRLSDENKDILNDLDNEKTVGKKKKKKIKKVAAKGDDETAKGGKGKAKKAKKVKKPKPEKPKKEPAPEPLIPEKKLKAKKVIPILVMCASLGVLIIVGVNASVDFTDKQSAKEAYYAGDYQTCYQNLFGKDNLDETEQIMFGTSKSILYIRLWLREYEMFAEAGEEVEALDSLIQTVNNYPALYDYAVQWKAGDEVMAGYAVILNILSEKYGLTEAQAQEIAAEHSDYKYTQRVVAIVQGKSFDSWNEPTFAQPDQNIEPVTLPDELPEEDELTDSRFIDGQ